MSMRGIFLSKLLALFIVGMFANSVEAALLYFDPATPTVNRGDTVTIALRIDTDEGECINAVDATISYDESIRAVDVSRGDSILSLWVEEPTIDETNRTVQFAGGLPGGYCGRVDGDPRLSNIIAEIVFRAPGFTVGASDTQSANIVLTDATQVLLNDNFGTKADLRVTDAKINLSNTRGPSVDDSWNERVAADDVPPSEFSITLTQDKVAFGGRYYIVFNSLDKQSGIDHYEVIEEPFEDFSLFSWGAADAPWKTTESPYVLEDQTLNSTIRVKAIDKAGNETITVLVPDEALRSITRQRFVMVVAFTASAFIIIAGIFYALWRRKNEIESRLIAEEDHSNTHENNETT